MFFPIFVSLVFFLARIASHHRSHVLALDVFLSEQRLCALSLDHILLSAVASSEERREIGEKSVVVEGGRNCGERVVGPDQVLHEMRHLFLGTIRREKIDDLKKWHLQEEKKRREEK